MQSSVPSSSESRPSTAPQPQVPGAVFAASVGPARFVDPATTDNVVLTLLASFDLFGLWNIAITAIGVSVIARVSRGAGWLASVVAVAISLLFSLIPAALS
jgi:hypothetical protein